MKGINKLITILLFIAVFVLLFFQLRGVGESSGSSELYASRLDSLSELYQKEKAESDELKDLNDSLSSRLIAMVDEGEPELESGEEAEVKQLIHDLHKGWESLVSSKNPDDVLQHFTEEFTTNEVKINTENLPYVRKHNNRNYREHLEAITEIEGMDIDMGASKIFSVFVRNDIFATQYLTELKVEHNGKMIMESTVLSLVSGQKEDGQWKVGNYSWIRFEYFDIIDSELNQ